MVVNVKNGKDMITLDFQLCQIRYCRDPAKHGELEFLNMSRTDMDSYLYLFENNKESFLNCLAEDTGNSLGKKINPANLEVFK